MNIASMLTRLAIYVICGYLIFVLYTMYRQRITSGITQLKKDNKKTVQSFKNETKTSFMLFMIRVFFKNNVKQKRKFNQLSFIRLLTEIILIAFVIMNLFIGTKISDDVILIVMVLVEIYLILTKMLQQKVRRIYQYILNNYDEFDFEYIGTTDIKKTLSNEILLMENSDTELTICIKMMLVIVFLDILSIFFT